MRRGFLLVLSLLGLTLVGCSSSEQRDAVDVTSDPAWQPPGQGDLAVADKPEEAPKKVRKPRARALQEPNHAELRQGPLASRDGLSKQ